MSSYREVDAVIIGGGHNALVAAAYLARAGWSVEVLEREDHLGGAVVTEELTLPGYRHDTFSGWHLLLQGSGAFAELGPDQAGGGFPLLTLAAVMHVVGMPVAEGGSSALIEALGRLISDHGGVTRTGVDVIEVICQPHRDGYRAVGVTVEGGEVLMARRAVIASTTPAQLYGRLLPIHVAPETARREAAAYRFGPGDVQIHLALSEPLRWRDSRLDEAPVINVTGGIDSLTLACAQSTASMLPAVPTFLLGQPHVLDPSRAPAGAGVIWIQLLQQPNNPVADAAGAIAFDRPGWSEAVRTAYAERVIGMVRDLTVNLDAGGPSVDVRSGHLPGPGSQRRVGRIVAKALLR